MCTAPLRDEALAVPFMQMCNLVEPHLSDDGWTPPFLPCLQSLMEIDVVHLRDIKRCEVELYPRSLESTRPGIPAIGRLLRGCLCLRFLVPSAIVLWSAWD